MKKVEFKYTDDSWIDAGIMGFWDYIEDEGIHQKFGVQINRDYYTISASAPGKIENFLKEIFERIKNRRYIQPTGNKVCIYNSGKDDFEVVDKLNLVNIAGALFSAGAGGLKPNYGKAYDLPKEKQERWGIMKSERQKEKVDFKTDKKGCVYRSRPQYNWPFKPNLNPERKEICTFCGSSNASSNIHSNNYPFLVPVKNWSNFYSNLSLELKMCTLCEIASLFAVNRIFYNINRRKKTLFMAIPHASSLDEMDLFWRDTKEIIGGKRLSEPSNIFDDGYRYQYLNETILAFNYKLYKSLKETVGADRRMNVISTKIWHFFLGDISGKIVSFRNNLIFDEMAYLFKLYESTEKERINFPLMFSNLVIKEGNDYNNLYREILSERIIKNASINEIAEKIIYKKGEKVRDFANFTKLYNLGRYV
ncbi:MAG: hypothetical protein DDT42_01272 [candidate division WS2 bacterium]|uniref:Type I-B CRISPR-associated protein Cas8b1/Cst1 n=1 Tax=Psychracetigena formicireducens TaxID=2986056 RepID=A0A9E2BIT2_PSYF1|nr:hypothetical protein [Candidatus Psychracetigena formicireducens]